MLVLRQPGMVTDWVAEPILRHTLYLRHLPRVPRGLVPELSFARHRPRPPPPQPSIHPHIHPFHPSNSFLSLSSYTFLPPSSSDEPQTTPAQRRLAETPSLAVVSSAHELITFRVLEVSPTLTHPALDSHDTHDFHPVLPLSLYLAPLLIRELLREDTTQDGGKANRRES
jgi:hypothetical protein